MSFWVLFSTKDIIISLNNKQTVFLFGYLKVMVSQIWKEHYVEWPRSTEIYFIATLNIFLRIKFAHAAKT